MPVIAGRFYPDTPAGALEFQMELMNSFDLDPEMLALRTAYGIAISFGGFGLASFLTATPMPSLFSQSITRAYMTAGRLRTIGTVVVNTSPAVAVAAVPLALSAGYAYQYEKHVNEPLRDSHGGAHHKSWIEGFTQGSWLGPYASGFGSVV